MLQEEPMKKMILFSAVMAFVFWACATSDPKPDTMGVAEDAGAAAEDAGATDAPMADVVAEDSSEG